jgi:ribonuclease H / adenosylcobalamin/alpha-ribazole phosphatase
VSARILLIRHAAHAHIGHTLSGRLPGLSLTAAGRAQAEALAPVVTAHAADRWIASPIERAQETAALLAGGAPVRAEDGLTEIEFGDWTGRRFDELAGDPAWVHWNARRSGAAAPGGETAAAAQARAVAALAREAARGGTVAAVTHCDIVRSVVCAVLGLSLDRLLRFEVDPASLTVIEMNGQGEGQLLRLNEVGR